MIWSMVRAIVILPGTALILVPAAILWASAGTGWAADPAWLGEWTLWLALFLIAPGLALAAWTSWLFVGIGKGTPAPWDAPRKLVIRGPYRHVRNPMISGVLVMLTAEAVFLGSWPLVGWTVFFFAANSVYFPLSEEPGLERRFGEAYRLYKTQVPR